jgi:hypothetical protein
MRYAAERRNLDDSIAELREIAGGCVTPPSGPMMGSVEVQVSPRTPELQSSPLATQPLWIVVTRTGRAAVA